MREDYKLTIDVELQVHDWNSRKSYQLGISFEMVAELFQQRIFIEDQRVLVTSKEVESLMKRNIMKKYRLLLHTMRKIHR